MHKRVRPGLKLDLVLKQNLIQQKKKKDIFLTIYMKYFVLIFEFCICIFKISYFSQVEDVSKGLFPLILTDFA